MRVSAKLTQILYDREITQKEDTRFLYRLQQAVLLALKEDGTLTETQFQYAEEKLKGQCRAAIRDQDGGSE